MSESPQIDITAYRRPGTKLNGLGEAFKRQNSDSSITSSYHTSAADDLTSCGDASEKRLNTDFEVGSIINEAEELANQPRLVRLDSGKLHKEELHRT